jgi:hypothetical protein
MTAWRWIRSLLCGGTVLGCAVLVERAENVGCLKISAFILGCLFLLAATASVIDAIDTMGDDES